MCNNTANTINMQQQQQQHNPQQQDQQDRHGLPLDLLDSACVIIAAGLSEKLGLVDYESQIRKTISRPNKKNCGDLTFPTAVIHNFMQRTNNGVCCATKEETVQLVVKALDELLQLDGSDFSNLVESYFQPAANDLYIGIFLRVTYAAQILKAITKQHYLAPLVVEKPKQVMIEYSQPNTHKAFHVGHMRNVALGDCLIRLKQHCGDKVIAANYFGDEGSHVAKCLWQLDKVLAGDKSAIHTLEVPPAQRGEFLGKMYTQAVNAVTLESLTAFPCVGAIVARVLTKEPHPNNPKWNICTLSIGDGDGDGDGGVTVVCGGTDYQVDDLVAYMPVGATFQKKEVVPTDMHGVLSNGIMLSYTEVGVSNPNAKEQHQKTKKTKKKKGDSNVDKSICVLTMAGATPGMSLSELGRNMEELKDEPTDETVEQIYARRQQEVASVLSALESNDPEWCPLWDVTKEWSLHEFRNIYGWLGARFDVEFFESEVSTPSMQLVQDYLSGDKGVFEKQNGAIGAVLDEYKLPFLMVVKSNGSGLYATKDLALAKRKFEEFNIDQSIYVVDKGQSLHFQQVFATLDKMGFDNAKKSVHLAYGQVVRPDGKMSSRKGTVIYFSDLKDTLTRTINEQFFDKYKQESDGYWTEEKIDEANRAIAVGTIRYGMLNMDPSKDITFDMNAWTSKTGNTGPYLMYAYVRIKSILDKANTAEIKRLDDVDVSLLNSPQDRVLLVQMTQFWPVVTKSASMCKPDELCKFLYELSQQFSSWYSNKDNSILRSDVPLELKNGRLLLVEAVAAILKTGIELLGMTTLERM